MDARTPGTSHDFRPRLAVISTYDELCGIAAYTKFLVKQLDPYFEVTVFELDQYLLRHTDKFVRKLGDQSIAKICKELRNFDCVNIQLEHGTLGSHAFDISRRLKKLVKAAPRLSISFHTIMASDRLDVGRFLTLLATLRWESAYRLMEDTIHSKRLAGPMYKFFRRQQRWKPMHFIVHTRRDFRFMKYVNRLDNVHHHPLSFLAREDAVNIRKTSDISQFPSLSALPKGTHLIGVFGFMGKYKGFDTVIKALGRLPENYHLAIFGGVHPNEIKRNQELDPYIQSLFDASYTDASLQDARGINITMQASDVAQLFKHPRDISNRIHFMGSLPDEGFLCGMALCDSVVLPYLEVGQSSSGPMSQSVELGCRVFAARNQAFLQFSRYHPDQVTFFDIGNYVELAEKLQAPQQSTERRIVDLKFNTLTNAELYKAANAPADFARQVTSSKPAPQPAGERVRTSVTSSA